MFLTDRDALMGAAMLLIGALFAILLKAWAISDTETTAALFVFGPGVPEPERTACEARELKRREETGE